RRNRRARCPRHPPGRSSRLALVHPPPRAGQYHHHSAAAEVPRAQPGRERLAVRARQLALQPHLQILRRSRRPLLCGMEQARRSALAHHVHRTAPMGPRVLINGIWYKTPRKPPLRRRNAEVRAREYLTDAEVAKLINIAGFNRHAHRDATMILLAYRHGLRAVELVTLRWDAIDFKHGRIHVRRAKQGSEAVHPLSGRELRALRRLKRDQEPELPFVFTTERAAPFTTAGFRKLIARLGVAAKLEFPVHPHMLRHAC